MDDFSSNEHPDWYILESSFDCSDETLANFLSICAPSLLSDADPDAEFVSVNHVPREPSAALNAAIRAHIGGWSPPYGQRGLTAARTAFWRQLYRLASDHQFVGGKWIFALNGDEQADNVWAALVRTRTLAAKLSLRGPRRYLSVVCDDFNDSRACVNMLRVALHLVRAHGVAAPTAFKADVVSAAFPFGESATSTLKAMRLTMPYADWQARRSAPTAVDQLDDSRLFHRALWLELESENQEKEKEKETETETVVSSATATSTATAATTSTRVRVASLLDDDDDTVASLPTTLTPTPLIPTAGDSLKRATAELTEQEDAAAAAAEPPKRPRLMKLQDLSDGEDEAATDEDDEDETIEK
jgi:hypothetical protein